MKRFLFLLVAAFCALAPVFAKDPALQDVLAEASDELCRTLDGNVKVIAIVDITSEYGTVSDYIADELTHAFAGRLKRTALAERNEHSLSIIKTELQYQNSGEVSDETIQSVGQALGADSLVLGSVKEVSGGYQITIRAVSVETKRVLVSWSGRIGKKDKEIQFQIKRSTQKQEKQKPKAPAEPPILKKRKPTSRLNASTSQLSSCDIADVFLQEIEKHGLDTNNYVLLWGVYEGNKDQQYDWGVYTFDDKKDPPFTVLLHTKNAWLGYYPYPWFSHYMDAKTKKARGRVLSELESDEFEKSFLKSMEKDGLYVPDNVDDVNKSGNSWYVNFLAASATQLKQHGGTLSRDELDAFDKIYSFFHRSCYGKDDIFNLFYQVLEQKLYSSTLIEMFMRAGIQNVDEQYPAIVLYSTLPREEYKNGKWTSTYTHNLKIVKALLACGANPNAEDATGGTPLIGVLAACYMVSLNKDENGEDIGFTYHDETSVLQIMQLLVQSGADVNIKDHENTLLSEAEELFSELGDSFVLKQAISLLKAHGAK